MSAKVKAPYKKPRFRYQDIIDELDAIRKAADSLLAPSASHIIPHTLDALRGSRTHDGVYDWQIPSPITTRRSQGEHHPRSQGPYDLEGQLDYCWTIRPEKAGKKTPAQTFLVEGKISTRVKLFGKHRNGPAADELLAAWRFEIGDDRSPGAFFHSQIDWHIPTNSHHSDCDVPRFASFLMTPGECLDFLLGELFQAEWPQSQQAHSAELKRWSANQRRRLSNLLDASKAAISNSSDVSPWIALKQWKPSNSDLMLARSI